MIIFNRSICKITIHPKSEYHDREVREFKKRIGWKWEGIIPKPIYEQTLYVIKWWSGEIVSKVEDYTHKFSYVEETRIYYKPHCCIYLVDQSKEEVYFETKDELEKYVKDLVSKEPHIKI